MEGWPRAKRERRIRELRRICRRATGMVTVSEGLAEEIGSLVQEAPSKLKVIPTPVVTDRLTTMAEQQVADDWMTPGQPDPILAVGRLTRQKDFATLVRGFALLRREHPCRLMILGEGEERQSLTELAEQLGVAADVGLRGFVSNPFAYLSRVRLLVSSSRWEGLPTVLIEALALGIPVVATDCPHGPREILEEGRLGALVPVGDPPALARAMRELLKSDVDPAPLKAAGARYSAQRGVERYLRLLGLDGPEAISGHRQSSAAEVNHD
jgi:glycosyltransferase involved in cell wall biosynthesis